MARGLGGAGDRRARPALLRGRRAASRLTPSPSGRRSLALTAPASRPEPLILTATLDAGAFDWFQALRTAHFPPARNVVPAHLTLFHALPGEAEAEIGRILAAACAGLPPMAAEVRGPWSLGRGVAYRLASPPLEALRAELASAFAAWLTPQDRAPFRPHVTVQNKADPAAARALLETLQHDFEPFEVWIEGLSLWRYMGGPWRPAARLPFGAS